jgi:hypothetical protein
MGNHEQHVLTNAEAFSNKDRERVTARNESSTCHNPRTRLLCGINGAYSGLWQLCFSIEPKEPVIDSLIETRARSRRQGRPAASQQPLSLDAPRCTLPKA